VRYIDDFVLCVGLTLEPTKTKLVEFGRFAQRHAGKHARRSPETIYFVGFSVLQRRMKGGDENRRKAA
jgi:RNA-directed DNA polymerase